MDWLGLFPKQRGWAVKEWIENLKFWTEVDGFEELRLNIVQSSLNVKQQVDWWKLLPDGSKDSWDHAEGELFNRFIPKDEHQQELRVMWRSESLKQHVGESSRAFGEKISRISQEMTSPPDMSEKIFKFRSGLIPAIRKRLTLSNYLDLEQWIEAAELAEADLLLESKGTTELTDGLLKDHQSGNHLINYHEGLQQEVISGAGVLALGITETESVQKPSSESKDEMLKSMQLKISNLEKEVSQYKKSEESKALTRAYEFPFRTKSESPEPRDESDLHWKRRNNNQQKWNKPKVQRYRSQRENNAKRVKRENKFGDVYCGRCRMNNHSQNDCWYNRYCKSCNKRGHYDEECGFRLQKNWKTTRFQG